MNAKEEFIEFCTGKANIKCAKIIMGDSHFKEPEAIIILKLNYSEKDYENFLNQLDFEYDDGYGGQELFGAIWFEDGSWAGRGEYDGSEWWERYSLPEIAKECL
jgi:hypothetical protein